MFEKKVKYSLTFANILLSSIVAFGSIYTLSLEPAPSYVITVKRALIQLFVILIFIKMVQGLRVHVSSLEKLVVICIAYTICLGFINSKMNEVIYQVASYFFIIAVLFYLKTLNPSAVRRLIKTNLILIEFVLILFCVLLFMHFVLPGFNAKPLLKKGFGNDSANFSIWLGSLSLLLTFLCLCFGFSKKKYFIYQVALIILTLLSDGRTGFLIASLSIFYYCWVKSKLLFLIVISFMILMVSFLIVSDRVNNRLLFTEEISFEYLDIYSAGRIHVARFAIESMASTDFFHLLFGMGIGEFYAEWGDTLYQVHNLFLRAYAETGIIGLLLVICLYLAPLINKHKNVVGLHARRLYLIASFTTLLSPGSFYSNLNTFCAVWVIFGLSMNYKGALPNLNLSNFKNS